MQNARRSLLSNALIRFSVGLVAALPAWAGPAAQEIGSYRTAHEAAILDEFMELLKIPNLASDPGNSRRNAEAIAAMMRRRGLSPRMLEPRDKPDAPPLVYGEWKVPKARQTLVLYAHYDGQPVNPSEWATSPWTPTLRSAPLNADGAVIAPDAASRLQPETRLYARGASLLFRVG